MFRSCPATGRLMHSFDPVTHRCKCGRWQAGYKPKQEPVMPRAECQICERQQALDNGGRLGHHGYQRPGCGYIQGDCMGVGHQPYPATDALVKYLQAIQDWIARQHARLAELETVTEMVWSYKVLRGDKKGTTQQVVVKKGAPTPHVPGWCVPDFEDLVKRARARAENEIVFAAKDELRVKARIAQAQQV